MLKYGLLGGQGETPTVLFVCDRRGATAFLAFLESLSGTICGNVVRCIEDMGFEAVGRWQLEVYVSCTNANFAMVQTGDDQGIVIRWWLSSDECQMTIEKVRALIAPSKLAGHQYLEKSGEVTIKISMNEWDGSVWKPSLRELFDL
jgi:hypothetical protein